MSRNASSFVNVGLRNVVAAILIGLGLLFVWEVRGTLMLTFAAVILVVFFTMPVRLLMHRFEMNRLVAIVLSVIGFFVVVTLIGSSILPTILKQFTELTEDVLPLAWQRAQEVINSGALVQQYPFLEGVVNFEFNDELVNQVVSQITDLLGRVGGSVLPVVGGVANTVLSVLIIFFMSMYLLAEPELYVNGIIKLTPKWYRERMRVVLRRVDLTLRAWLSVTAVSMIVVGMGTGLGLAVLGIQEWVALGVLAGVLSFIPNFGHCRGDAGFDSSCRPYSSGSSSHCSSGRQYYLDSRYCLWRVLLSESGFEPCPSQRTHEYASGTDLAWSDYFWFLFWFPGSDAGSAA